MHIKQITIQGFKSYKDQTRIDPFSERHNVVVGRNGSGKSNFFSAIRFVLSDTYAHLTREERQQLLHEGSGTAVMSAYVEIVFDNTDQRFPTGKDEVILRRTIGLKKDEYSLDRKNASKSDVMNLLESAGFSRSNPYYIVPQGRITSLTNAKDSDRLNLLKEVAGTKVYEQRRQESLKIMDETDSKSTKIDELLQYIEERLAELETEKEELREYQEKDKERRCLDYALKDADLQRIDLQIAELDQLQRSALGRDGDDKAEFEEREKEIEELETLLTGLRHDMNQKAAEVRMIYNQRDERVVAIADLECTVENLEDDQKDVGLSKDQVAKDLAAVEHDIKSKESQLQKLLPKLTSTKDKEAKAKQSLDEAQSEESRLRSKQGRQVQFKSKAERDKAITSEIGQIQQVMKRKESLAKEMTSKTKDLENQISAIEKEVGAVRTQLDGRKEAIEELARESRDAEEEKAKLDDERRELWRLEAKVSAEEDSAKDELRKAEQQLHNTMDRNVQAGLAAASRIAKDLKLSGYHGPLYELFTLTDSRYRTAAEVTAGGSLFHAVVDTDETARKILEVLIKEKAGRVTFIPLSAIRVKPVKYPIGEDGQPLNETVPILERIEPVDEKFRKALQSVYSRTIVCTRLETAAELAREYQLDGVTLNGSRSDRKGALTGGYHDVSHSRLQAAEKMRKWRSAYEDKSAEARKIKARVEEIHQEVTRLVGTLKNAKSKRTQIDEGFGPLQRDLQTKYREEHTLKDILYQRQQSLESLDLDIKNLRNQIASMQDEMKTEYKKTLTNEELDRLEQLGKDIEKYQKLYSDASIERLNLETEKQSLEQEIRTILYPRRDQLKSRSADDDDSQLEERRKELESLKKALADILARQKSTENDVEKIAKSMRENHAKLTELQTSHAEIARQIERNQKNVEQSMAKRTNLLHQREECNQGIRDLGVLPQEAYEKYRNSDPAKLLKKLHKVQESLKKFSGINKKAFEQFNNFTKQRESLMSRREELETSQQSIRELIEVLDQRKDEAIERTFKQVSKYFSEVFEKLVPAGKGRLVIQRKHDLPEEEASEKSVENYVGVAISVSFNSKDDEQQRIQQLSGGQKSLCALALIFAIQQCDPAPFYCLDELDANLDAQYRTAVASMIHELSQDAQYICTTFRPEMIQVADKYFGVIFQNKVSSIQEITKENALDFVEQEQPQ